MPFTQIQELQFVSSISSIGISISIALYGDNVVVFKQTDDGSDNTGIFQFFFTLFLELNFKTINDYLHISHRAPRLPFGQMHVNPPIPSIHVAPPRQGCGEHSFTFIRQSGPENPCAHAHRNQPLPDSHVPPLWHGVPWH